MMAVFLLLRADAMPTTELHLPLPGAAELVPLCYLSRDPAADIAYPQRVRSMVKVQGARLDDMKLRYDAGLTLWAGQLSAHIEAPVSAVVSPPSDHPQLTSPYRDALLRAFPGAVDLTDRLARSGSAKAGEGAGFKDLLAALDYTPHGDESGLARIVIVDDVVKTGTTAAALIACLRNGGVPKTTSFRIAAPLWLR